MKKIMIYIPHDELKPVREGYQTLMSIAIEKFHKAAELKSIQKARMMIGVINVSDDYTSVGRSLDTPFLLSKQKYI